jgi:hypothetical protein
MRICLTGHMNTFNSITNLFKNNPKSVTYNAI